MYATLTQPMLPLLAAAWCGALYVAATQQPLFGAMATATVAAAAAASRLLRHLREAIQP